MSEGLHPKDQWQRVYVYTDWHLEVREGTPVFVRPSWGPKPGEPLHLHHPDYYHPDPRVRIAHHRGVRESGMKIVACGAEVDPRVCFVEEHGEAERCPNCVAARAAAEDAHAGALRELERRALEAKLHAALRAEETRRDDKPEPPR